jgi:hypothetical protein
MRLTLVAARSAKSEALDCIFVVLLVAQQTATLDLRLKVRPNGLGEPNAAAIMQSMRPVRRTVSIVAAAEQRRLAHQRGQVCNDPAIQGAPHRPRAGCGRVWDRTGCQGALYCGHHP